MEALGDAFVRARNVGALVLLCAEPRRSQQRDRRRVFQLSIHKQTYPLQENVRVFDGTKYRGSILSARRQTRFCMTVINLEGSSGPPNVTS